MVASGAWTQIEAAPEQPRTVRRPPGVRGVAAAGATATGTAPAPGEARLRRHHRPVLGSLDAGGVAFQRTAGAAILGSAVFLVPLMIVNLLLTREAFERFEEIDGAVISAAQLFTGVDAASGVETAATYLALVTSSLAVALAGGYVALLLVRRSMDAPDDPRACLREALRRAPAIAAAWALSHAWVLLAYVVVAQATVEDLAAGAVILIPVGVWLVGWTALVVPAVVAERIGPWRGVRRALRLARARAGTMFAFSAACVVIGGGLRATIAALPRLVESTGIITFGGWAWLAEGVASQLALLVVVPLIGFATAALYLQVRIDAEALDLVVEAERAFHHHHRHHHHDHHHR